jgi:hypothetical protein
MPDTQAILAVAWGLILAHFVTESQILWCMGLAFFSKPFAISSLEGCCLEVVSRTVEDIVPFQSSS